MKQQALPTVRQNNIIDFGFIPPQAVEVEESILGILLTSEKSLKQVIGILSAEAFYKESHQHIYSAIIKLHADGIPIDTLSVVQELRKINKLEEVGGASFVAGLTRKIMTAGNLEFYTKIVIEKYILREIISGTQNLNKDAYQDGADIFNLLETFKTIYETLINLINKGKKTKDFCELLQENVQKYFDGKKLIVGKSFSIGVSKFDNNLMFEVGDLIILAARPGMGKTAFSLFLSRMYLKRGMKVLFLSMEMTQEKLTSRVLCAEGNFNNKYYRNSSLLEHEEEKIIEVANSCAKWDFVIDEESNMNVNSIEAKLLQAQEIGIDICFIDYLGLISLPNKDNKNNELGEVSRRLKCLAKQCKMPIVALHQLNRDVEKRADKRPILADLRDSGNIEQDADIVLFLHRPDYYFQEREKTNEIEIIISKYREGESGKFVKLKHNETISTFYDGDTEFQLDPRERNF